MDGFSRLENGVDRVCASPMQVSGIACWRAPESFEDAAEEAKRARMWASPEFPWSPRSFATWREAEELHDNELTRHLTSPSGPRPDLVAVGGTFDCAMAFSDWTRDIMCLGSLKYGEQGTRKAGWLEGHFVDFAAGTWHACGRLSTGDVVCWGRDDYGQLGFPAPETCAVLTTKTDCAPVPTKVPFELPRPGTLRAGDLFTCTAGAHRAGVLCWGANRDGFFGTRGQCDEALVAAWPTLAGPIVAPAPACASAPAPVAALRGLTIDKLANADFDAGEVPLDYAAGPRGVCLVHGGRVRCAGAILTPPSTRLTHVRVSPGKDASACALTPEKKLVCWGDGYSPNESPNRPVIIQLAPLPFINHDDAAIDYGHQGPQCLVNKPCFARIKPPLCDPAVVAASTPWPEVLSHATELASTIVRVRGPLQTFQGVDIHMGCRDYCCAKKGLALVIGDADPPLALDGIGCPGDESRFCCAVVPRGSLVATGRLEKDDRPHTNLPWKLIEPELCAIPP
jgi:hypothetical protein